MMIQIANRVEKCIRLKSNKEKLPQKQEIKAQNFVKNIQTQEITSCLNTFEKTPN